VGNGSPGLREAEIEGGEGFYIAQSGRRADLLVLGGGGSKTEMWNETNGNVFKIIASTYTETWTLREELICHPTIYRLRDSERGSSGLHSPGLFSHRQQ
jgi:hypothetical protein